MTIFSYYLVVKNESISDRQARLVLVMCCLYVGGAVVYSLSSITPIMTTVMLAKVTGIGGLLLVALCTGLMKAAYISLGAEQYKLPEQRDQQKR